MSTKKTTKTKEATPKAEPVKAAVAKPVKHKRAPVIKKSTAVEKPVETPVEEAVEAVQPTQNVAFAEISHCQALDLTGMPIEAPRAFEAFKTANEREF